METVEMDLMQAQIGSLATDVSRLEAKVAKGGGGGNSMFVITPLYEEVEGEPTVSFDKTYQEIASAIANKIPILIDDSDEEGMSAYMIPQISIQNGIITLRYPLTCYKNAPTTVAINDMCYKIDEENNVDAINTEYVVALNQ